MLLDNAPQVVDGGAQVFGVPAESAVEMYDSNVKEWLWRNHPDLRIDPDTVTPHDKQGLWELPTPWKVPGIKTLTIGPAILVLFMLGLFVTSDPPTLFIAVVVTVLAGIGVSVYMRRHNRMVKQAGSKRTQQRIEHNERMRAAREQSGRMERANELLAETKRDTPLQKQVPQEYRLWWIGSLGEQKTARLLDPIPDIAVFHDLGVDGSNANVDHVVVTKAGFAYVIDSKQYRGHIGLTPDRTQVTRDGKPIRHGERYMLDPLRFEVTKVTEQMRSDPPDVLLSGTLQGRGVKRVPHGFWVDAIVVVHGGTIDDPQGILTTKDGIMLMTPDAFTRYMRQQAERAADRDGKGRLIADLFGARFSFARDAEVRVREYYPRGVFDDDMVGRPTENKWFDLSGWNPYGRHDYAPLEWKAPRVAGQNVPVRPVVDQRPPVVDMGIRPLTRDEQVMDMAVDRALAQSKPRKVKQRKERKELTFGLSREEKRRRRMVQAAGSSARPQKQGMSCLMRMVVIAVLLVLLMTAARLGWL